MAFENGRLYTCDRCGAQAFTKTTGDGVADGGYTRWNNFEKLPGWSHENSIGTMCPTCTDQWKSTVEKFKQGSAL